MCLIKAYLQFDYNIFIDVKHENSSFELNSDLIEKKCIHSQQKISQ